MADEPTPQANKQPAPPNQTLIMGLILGAMVLLLVLVVITRGPGSSSNAEAELDDLRALVANRQAELNAERERLGLAPIGSGSTVANLEALAGKISSDAANLGTLASDLEKSMADQATRLANAEAARDSLSGRISDLNKQLADALGKAGDGEKLTQTITDLEARLVASQERVAELQDELANSPSQSELDSLRNQLASASSERDVLAEELATLRSETAGMVEADELAELRAQVAELAPENNRLRYDVQRLQALLDRASLFVESADDLAPAAQRLITELRGLESADGAAEIQQEYIRINAELKASVIDTINFATDSSRIDFDKAESLRRLLADTGDDSFLLVVGYASTTGDFETNEVLSSERAARVASVVNAHKKDGQKLQGVFFGQTDRFSPSEATRNQLCEVWEIRP